MDDNTAFDIDPQALDFRQARLLVIGDLMLDQYWLGDTHRISPEAPVPVIQVNHQQERLGGAANAALNVKTLGAKVSIAGIVGKDVQGKKLCALIEKADIDNACLQSDGDQTITKLRIISQNQQMVRADFETAFDEVGIKKLTENAIEMIAQHDAIILSDYNKGTLTHCQRIIQAAKETNTPVIVDPKGHDFTRYKDACILTPNLKEFEAIVGVCHSREVLIDKAQGLINALNLKALLITLSENGMALCLANGEYHHFNSLAKEVFDVTGAGDTVIATLATGIASGLPVEQAVSLANTAASIVVSRLGASQVTCLDLKVALDSHTPANRAILDIAQLQAQINFEKSMGKKIVFTNGCFDILHKGHTAYLQEAKALGDRLIVAVNDDKSIKRLKGETRPVNGLEDRMSLLASLAAVDFVIPFTHDTPCDLLDCLKPDILVKGGDYAIEEVVGIDIVQAYGGEVKVLSLQKGRSTTQIIDTIIHSHTQT